MSILGADIWRDLENRASILRQLKARAEKCRRCELHKTRTNLVFGVGPVDAKVMIASEAPGFWEDQLGVPYVGTAGKYLNTLLRIAGLKRDEIYIANTLKCRPPSNRDPLPREIEACRPFLEGQISVIKPKLILTPGRIAARELLGRPVSMDKEHGSLFDCTYAGVRFKLFVTYHPAATRYGFKIRSVLEADFKKLGQLMKSMG